MGKEDFSVKITNNYMSMFNNMLKPAASQPINMQSFYLPFLMSGNSGLNAMPYLNYNSNSDGLMNFINSFFEKMSKSIAEFEKGTISFIDATKKDENSGTTASPGENPPAAPQEKITNPQALKMLTKEQIEATERAAKEINCDPNDLVAVMYNESGLKPEIYNKAGSGNVGLIQFGRAAAADLGTTTEEISKMSYTEQLEYVVKYFNLVKKRSKIADSQKLDAGTLYAMIFRPAYANKEVVAAKGEAAYDKYYNYRLDINHDGKITKEDLAYHVNKQKKTLGLTA